MQGIRLIIGKFENAFGGVWIPVKFCKEPPKGEARALRFCEAVTQGRRQEVVLTSDSITCPGAGRSFGWAAESDEDLATKLADKQSIPLVTAKKMFNGVPKLTANVSAVAVGTKEVPDVLISYLQAPVAMNVARAFEEKTGGPIKAQLSSVLSVCGNVAVRSFLSGEITLSLGCETSRECGAIGRDRLIMGVPWSMVLKLLEATR